MRGYEQLDPAFYPNEGTYFLGDFTNGFYVGSCQAESGLSPAARPGTNSPASW